MSIRAHDVVLAGLFAVLVTASAHAQQSPRRVGVGAAIGNVYDLFPVEAVRSTEDGVAAPAILIPLQITNGFRLEPEIAVFRHSHEEPIAYSANGVELGVGIFPQMIQQNFRLYYGVRVGYVRTKEEETDSPGFTHTQSVDGYFVAPAVGGEYLLSDRFGLGAEVQFRHMSVTGNDVISSARMPSRPPEVVERRLERSVSATRVLFVTRFYF